MESQSSVNMSNSSDHHGMRIFLAGASGVIGQRLIPLLVQAGHIVGGMTRSPSKMELLSHLGPNRFFVMSSTGRH